VVVVVAVAVDRQWPTVIDAGAGGVINAVGWWLTKCGGGGGGGGAVVMLVVNRWWWRSTHGGPPLSTLVVVVDEVVVVVDTCAGGCRCVVVVVVVGVGTHRAGIGQAIASLSSPSPLCHHTGKSYRQLII